MLWSTHSSKNSFSFETQLAMTQTTALRFVGGPQRHGPVWCPMLIARWDVANPVSSSPAQMTSSA